MFRSTRFSTLNDTPLYLVPTKALLEKSPLLHSLQVGDSVFGHIKILEFLMGCSSRDHVSITWAAPFAPKRIRISESLASSAARWCLMAHPHEWSILVLFVFFSVDCLDPTCSSHGVCVNGECLCSPGWGGLNCELARVQCPDQCSGHGTYVPDTGLCSCDPNWMGPDCSVGKPRGFLLAFPNTHALWSSVSPNGWESTLLTGIKGLRLIA